MKTLVRCLTIILFLPNLSFCQNNAIRLNVKSWHQYDRNVVINHDSIDFEHNPESDDKYSFYDISFTYLKDLKKSKLFFGGGYNWSKSLYKSSRDVDTLFLEKEAGQKARGFQVHFGLLKSIPLNEGPFSINAGIGLYLSHTFSNKYISEYRLTDLQEGYVRGQRLEIDYTSRTNLGPNLEIGFYYAFWEHYAVGINLNTWFYWEYDNGTNAYKALRFGQQKSLTDESGFDHAIKRSVIGKSHYFSFSLQRNF